MALEGTYEGMAGMDDEITVKKEDAISSILRLFATVSCPPGLVGSNSNEHPGGMAVIVLSRGTIRLLT
jgi:hypothetical protein